MTTHNETTPSQPNVAPPYLLLTALLDASARSAAVTRSHADAYERAWTASRGKTVAGLEIVELPVVPAAFAALRSHLRLPKEAAGIYDIFPVAGHLQPELRKVAGQFLAADALWTLDEQGMLGGVPLRVQLDLPQGWDKDPKGVHKRLVEAGALDIDESGIHTFRETKALWDASAPKG